MTEQQIEILEADYDLSGADAKSERVKAIVTLVIVFAVNIANIFGYSVDAEPWINAVLTILSGVSIAWTWWKNQNVTDEAAQAQVLLNALKAENKKAKHAAQAE